MQVWYSCKGGYGKKALFLQGRLMPSFSFGSPFAMLEVSGNSSYVMLFCYDVCLVFPFAGQILYQGSPHARLSFWKSSHDGNLSAKISSCTLIGLLTFSLGYIRSKVQSIGHYLEVPVMSPMASSFSDLVLGAANHSLLSCLLLHSISP